MSLRNTFLKRLETLFRDLAFRQALVSKLLGMLFGRVAFRFSVIFKRISLSWGLLNQRSVEYSWLLNHLQDYVRHGAVVLDVGCAESLLSHELVARGHRVVGIDIRDYPWKNPKMSFYRRNVIDTGFPSSFFDAAVLVSTIEHIGLNSYGQLSLDDEGDIKAMHELHRILKDGGVIFLTTPYVGNNPSQVNPFERNYNEKRLNRLTQGFKIVKEDYYLPIRTEGKKWVWLKVTKDDNRFQIESIVGLACLVLAKEPHQIKV
jgi:SAM-dependent methyltransferase